MTRRLLRLVHAHIGDALLVLACLAIAVTVRNAGFRTVTEFRAMPLDTRVDLLSKVIGTTIAVLGAVVTYRKYFKGRTFATRARLEIVSRPVRWLVPVTDGPRVLLHSVDVEVENVGTVTIWEPELRLRVRRVDADEDLPVTANTDGIEADLSPGGLDGVDPGEKQTHHFRVEVPEDLRVFRVCVDLISSKRDAWHRATTLANTFNADEE